MNALTKVSEEADRSLIEFMRDALYPGAKIESVATVLKYCRARNLDPMLKPVHIVPMFTKDIGMVDVPLPGIALYRIQASRSGLYNGKSEPEFGPDTTRDLGGRKITFPAWCRVTVRRGAADFTAKEFWLENYATTKRDSDTPNAMWAKRPYGQLAKCAEAQALRMAFPEVTGGDPTAEEMEGKSFEPMPPARGPTIDQPREEERPPGKLPVLSPDGEIIAVAPARWAEAVRRAVAKMEDAAALGLWERNMAPLVESVAENGHPELVDAFNGELANRWLQVGEAEAVDGE